MYVQVSIPISSFKTFTYSADSINKKLLFPGQSVCVTFRNKVTNGFIISTLNKPSFKGKVLPIKSINNESFNISKELWETLCWISQYYICSLGKTLQSTIPYQHITKLDYSINKKVFITDLGENALKNNLIQYTNQKKILHYLDLNQNCFLNNLSMVCTSYRATCKRLEALNFITITKEHIALIDGKNKKYNLTDQQNNISNKILSDWKYSKKPALLTGVSGSGKTLIYIDIMKSFITKKKDIIILVPEIALIHELYNILVQYFSNSIICWHSKMKTTEKKQALLTIKNKESSILISTRSGLFAPLSNLGLIIVDEEQEATYKEDGKAPYYNAREAALMRAKFSKSNIILVSSSPSLESFSSGENNIFSTYELKNRFKKYDLPKILIINMKNKENYGKGLSIISRKLAEEIEVNLNNKKQVLLLHNKTGEKIQKIEEILKKLFSNFIIARYDRDSIKGNNYYKILEDFHNNKINILLGTQMIAKGIDFKNVSLVGILNADFGISSPDFRSDEKLFQLAYQFIGRAGRHSNSSKAFIQSFNIDNVYIKNIYEYNINNFYNYILEDRKSLFYPPFSRIIRIVISGSNRKITEKKSEMLYDLFAKNRNLKVIGPSEAPIQKINNQWRYHLLIKMKKNYWIKLFNWIENEIGLSIFENNSNNLKIKLDVDPIFFL